MYKVFLLMYLLTTYKNRWCCKPEGHNRYRLRMVSVLRRIFGLRGRKEYETSENCITRSFVNFTLRQTILKNQV
jgi:hypothetical protein